MYNTSVLAGACVHERSFGMNKKITRRAVLGTAIAGLVAAPFVMLGFRRRRSFDMNFAYGKIEIPLDQIDSDLPVSERVKALEAFEKERNRWLLFRGVEGDVHLKKTLLASGQDVSEDGYFQLKFDLRLPSDSMRGEHAPHDVQMSLSESKGGPLRWGIRWRGRLGGRPEMLGDDSGSFGSHEVFTLFAPLIIQGLTAVPNELLMELLPLLRLSADSTAGSFELGANSTKTQDGMLIPTLKFVAGYYFGHVPKRLPNVPYPVCTMTDAEQSGSFSFPKKFELKPVANGGVLADGQNEELSVVFANPAVFAT